MDCPWLTLGRSSARSPSLIFLAIDLQPYARLFQPERLLPRLRLPLPGMHFLERLRQQCASNSTLAHKGVAGYRCKTLTPVRISLIRKPLNSRRNPWTRSSARMIPRLDVRSDHDLLTYCQHCRSPNQSALILSLACSTAMSVTSPHIRRAFWQSLWLWPLNIRDVKHRSGTPPFWLAIDQNPIF